MTAVAKYLPSWGATVVMLAIMWASILGAPVAGFIEGRMYPVMTPLTIDGTPEAFIADSSQLGTDTPQRWSNIDAHATQLRACTYIRIDWFFGHRFGNRVPIHGEFLDIPSSETIGQPGPKVWKNLIVGIDPTRINETFANLVHRCHIGWDTVTPFWTGKDAE